MALPEGVTTATVTAGVPVSHTGGPVKAFLSIEPSVFLVHTATGTPLVDFIEELDISEGVAGQFTLPHTDQAGFQDENGNAYTNWYYTARLTYSTPSKAKTKAPKIKVFQLATGQTVVDLDSLPGGAPALPYTAPIATVTSMNGRTGPVTVQDADVPALAGRLSDASLSATYGPEAQAASDPLKEAFAAVRALNVGIDTMGKWRSKIAAVRAGTGQAKLLCVGDSTTIGYQATVAQSYPSKLVAALADYIPAAKGLAIPVTDASDPRWETASWVMVTSFGWGDGRAYVADNNTKGTLAFTPGIECDTFDVYLFGSGGYGTVSVNIDGGAATTLNTATLAGTPGKVTVTAAPGSSHVVNITNTSAAAPVAVLGVDAYLSTTPKVRVGNAGKSGSTTAQWGDAQGVTSGSGSSACIRAYAPDLTLVMLGINDSIAGVTEATWTANITKTINAGKASGSVILMSTVPSGPSVTTAGQIAYRNASLALAKTLGVGYIDVYARFGSYATAQPFGFYADETHPNAVGYSDMAHGIAAALKAI